MTTEQVNVFDRILKEREYQTKKYGLLYDDSKWTVEDWTRFIMEYLPNKRNPVPLRHPEYDARTQLIKVAALAVAALEQMEKRD